jgi:Eukaryotic aspartyl protease
MFDPKQSSTFKKQRGSPWNISYCDHSSPWGDVGTNNITIGRLTIKSEAVVSGRILLSDFVQESGSGLLGLTFGNINTVTPRSMKTPA